MFSMVWSVLVALPGPTIVWVIVLYLYWYLLVGRKRRRRRTVWYPPSRETVVVMEREVVDLVPNRVARNKREVIGWELIDPAWLEEYEPDQLQAKIDELSPYHAHIVSCLTQLETPEFQAETPQASALRQELTQTVEKLRNQYVAHRFESMAPYAQEALDQARAALPVKPPESAKKYVRRKRS